MNKKLLYAVVLSLGLNAQSGFAGNKTQKFVEHFLSEDEAKLVELLKKGSEAFHHKEHEKAEKIGAEIIKLRVKESLGSKLKSHAISVGIAFAAGIALGAYLMSESK